LHTTHFFEELDEQRVALLLLALLLVVAAHDPLWAVGARLRDKALAGWLVEHLGGEHP